MLHSTHYPSPIGAIILTSDGSALTGLYFEGQSDIPPGLCPIPPEELPVFRQTGEWLDRYFRGERPDTLPPLRPEGTPFQTAVWRLLTEIPYGATTTYGTLTARLSALQGNRRISAQAVGGAVGRNPISILIPCHRVLGAGGNLTGYAGGLHRKQFLLDLEQK